jgi:uncharacterized membrane protein
VPNLHPVLTHFPIALFTVGLLFDLLAVLLKNTRLENVGWWSQVSGSVGLAAAIVSGLLAKSAIQIPGQAISTFETHEQIAFLVAALAASLLLWRISSLMLLPPRMKTVYLLLMAIMVVVMWIGAWYGGELVYSFGTGVRMIN